MSGSESPAPAALTDKQIERLYRALLLSENPRRDRAILQLFLRFGCTVRDVIELAEQDVDLAAGRIRWRRAGHLAWEDLPAEVARALRDYVQRERRGPCPRLFTTRLGHPLTPSQVARLFRFLQRESGLAHLNPNTLRERHRRLLAAEGALQDWFRLRRCAASPCGPCGGRWAGGRAAR